MTAHTQGDMIRKCYACKGLMEGRKENYRYTECGLNSVVLVDIVVFHCKCGEIVPEIPATDPLHEALMIDLLKKPTLLSAEEIRFLRKMAGYSAIKLAQTMGIRPEVVSRWENDKAPIGKESDRLLRFACAFQYVQQRNLTAEDADIAGLLAGIRRLTSLRLPEILRKIEDQQNGPKEIRINPEMLGQLGRGSSDCIGVSSEAELVQ